MALKEFLSSEKEQHAWHRGVRKGLDMARPSQLLKDFREYESLAAWEEDEQQYEDFAMLVVFGIKKAVLWISYKAKSIKPGKTK